MLSCYCNFLLLDVNPARAHKRPMSQSHEIPFSPFSLATMTEHANYTSLKFAAGFYIIKQ